jgi:hypothetical protein
MRTLSILEIDFVAGGDDAEDGGGNFASHYASENRMEAGPSIYVGGGGEIQTVEIIGSRESAASARASYETAMGLANVVTAAAGIGASLAVNGACSGGSALIGGAIGGPPGALATAAAMKSSCGWISGIAGGAAGTYTSGQLTKYINNM